ncbi:MAG: TolC family protein [Geobacteraceae bacterium]|nr:TolC family protein [Geobacteraceae bacterium]
MKALYLTGMALFLMAVCTTRPGSAAEPVRGKVVLDLKECVRKALDSAPELGEAQADITLTASKLEEAKAYRYPQIEIVGLTGPVPQARGNQVSSSDSINQTDRWTWFSRADATITQPLYTFGKIAESMKAAGHGIEVDRARKEQRRNEIAVKVKEYYYGILLARELKEVLLEVREDLVKAREKAVKLLDQGSPNVEELDLYKLDTFEGEVDKYLEEAKKGEALALTALAARIGLPAEAELEIAGDRLVPEQAPLPGLDAYLESSRDKRPEYRQIKEGLQARESLVKAARAAWYPDIFLAGYLSAAYAEKRDRVTNPWVPDQFNHLWGGVALGLKWKLDFGITGAKVAGERAQYDRLVHTRAFAETNIPLQIRRFHLDLNEAQRSMEAARNAYSNAKKWAVAAIANFDFGIGPAKEIFDSLQEYAKMRAAYFQSIYNYNLALANLDYAVGEAPL